MGSVAPTLGRHVAHARQLAAMLTPALPVHHAGALWLIRRRCVNARIPRGHPRIQHRCDEMTQRDVGLASQIGDVDRDAASRFENSMRLREHSAEEVEELLEGAVRVVVLPDVVRGEVTISATESSGRADMSVADWWNTRLTLRRTIGFTAVASLKSGVARRP